MSDGSRWLTAPTGYKLRSSLLGDPPYQVNYYSIGGSVVAAVELEGASCYGEGDTPELAHSNLIELQLEASAGRGGDLMERVTGG